MARVTLERSPTHGDWLAANLWDLTKDDTWTDFSISVGNTRLPCHRIVLAASSPMLRAAISADMAERRKCEINLDLFSVAAMEVVLQYMYIGEVTIESNMLKELLQAADYLQMGVLKQQCIDLVMRGSLDINPENVISWCTLALQYDLHDVTAMCSNIATTWFSEVIQTEEFLCLGARDIRDFFDLVQNGVLNDLLLEATLLWISHNIEERVDYFEDLLKTIKPEYCSQEVLQQQIDLHAELLDARPNVFKTLFKASITPHQLQNNTNQAKKCRTIFKKISERLAFIGGNEGDRRDCWYLDLKTHRMTKFTETPAEIWYNDNSVCKTPDGFVVTGGETSDICAKYNTFTGSWVRLQNMPGKRRGHGSIWVRGKLYVIGGIILGKSTSSVDYLSSDGIWRHGPALPWGICSHPLIASIDRHNVYVLDKYTGRIFVLDLSQTYSRGWRDWFWSVWKQQASVPGAGWVTALTAAIDRLYVYGACNDFFAYYMPDSNTWCKTNIPTLRDWDNRLIHCDDKVYLIGRLLGKSNDLDELEEYHPTTQKWKRTGYRFQNKLPGYVIALTMPE